MAADGDVVVSHEQLRAVQSKGADELDGAVLLDVVQRPLDQGGVADLVQAFDGNRLASFPSRRRRVQSHDQDERSCEGSNLHPTSPPLSTASRLGSVLLSRASARGIRRTPQRIA